MTRSAPAPYGKPFTYRPQFKLWLSTNHKPEIPDGSEAIWDRLRLIPFLQRFEGKGVDPKLPEKLRKELSGVLMWAVRGCVEWGKSGLGSAAAVDRATAEYRAETDVIDRFFDDVCVFGPNEKMVKKGLYLAWETWCMDEGESDMGQNKFTRIMGERGVVRNFVEKKVRGTRVWSGISVEKVPPDGNLPPAKDLQTEGCSSSRGQVSEDFQNFSTEPPTREGFSKNGQNLPHLPPGGPTTFEFDGLEVD